MQLSVFILCNKQFDTELDAIQGIARAFLSQPNRENVYRPQAETELLKRVDTALDHIQQGVYRDAAEVDRDIRRRYGLQEG